MPRDPELHLHEPFAAPEIVVDGVSDIRIEGHTVRCVTYSLQAVAGVTDSQPVASARLVMTRKGATELVARVSAILKEYHTASRPARHRRKPG